MHTGLPHLWFSFQTTHICLSNVNRNNVSSSEVQYLGLAWQSFTQRREDKILSFCSPSMVHFRLCEAQLSFFLFLSPFCPQVLYFSVGLRHLGLQVRFIGILSNWRNGQNTPRWASMATAIFLWIAYVILLKFMVESFWEKKSTPLK